MKYEISRLQRLYKFTVTITAVHGLYKFTATIYNDVHDELTSITIRLQASRLEVAVTTYKVQLKLQFKICGQSPQALMEHD